MYIFETQSFLFFSHAASKPFENFQPSITASAKSQSPLLDVMYHHQVAPTVQIFLTLSFSLSLSLSPTIRLYHPSLPVGPPNYIQYPHRTDINKFLLVGHVLWSIEERLLLVRVYVEHLYSSTDTAITWKKSGFILSDGSDFHMIDNLSIAIHV